MPFLHIIFFSCTAEMDGNAIMVNLLWNVFGQSFLSKCKNDAQAMLAKRHMFLQFAHEKLNKKKYQIKKLEQTKYTQT